ncbi:hypothetical protein HYDPIDRAFT_37644 [Hydnomerulius pinastri MD-312]|nr:hypothetical protein HYDPIDRAFT_37644 [Hydnomerulius pinastri MD-312]
MVGSVLAGTGCQFQVVVFYKLMFSFLFSCCGFRQHRDGTPVVPHERTPLIPATEDTPTPQPRVVDHQKLKERLGTVVRSKEGSVLSTCPHTRVAPTSKHYIYSDRKMVNVNAQFPFNLHNQELGEPSLSRSSRNVSGGTYSSSRQASPSPCRSLQKSRSSTSVHREAEDPSSSQHLPSNDYQPVSILNVRLVKPGAWAGSTRTGINSRVRPGHNGEYNGRSGVVGLDSAVVAGFENENRELAGDKPDDEELTPRAHPPPPRWEDRSPTDVAPADPSADLILRTPPYPEDFTINDAGAVSRSWGD